MNKFAKICLGIAGAIMLTFFIVQTCIVMRWCEPTYFLAEFGYGCVIAFMPPFFYVVYDFIRHTKLKEANIDAASYDNMRQLMRSLSTCLSKGDIILVKGSRGMHMERVVEFLTNC